MGPSTVFRIEVALSRAIAEATAPPCPPRLASGLRHAVFPPGQRIRPRLTLAVAEACGDARPQLAEAAATAIELLHCASLVHDDLPCFDDAPIRRGRPTVHRAYGEPTAVLVGDGLIVLAFEGLARAGAAHPQVLAPLVAAIARGVGPTQGIVGGQAWEEEPAIDLGAYHRAKTAALFEAAVGAGAIAGGGDALAWDGLGARLGEAWQVADDLLDVTGSAAMIGKPVGQDEDNGRPNAAHAYGVDGAHARLRRLLSDAMDAVPRCPGREGFQGWLRQVTSRIGANVEPLAEMVAP